MTPEQYAEKRMIILEKTLRHLMMTLCAASPALSVDIDVVGRNWDQALDHLDSEWAWSQDYRATTQAPADQPAARQGEKA